MAQNIQLQRPGPFDHLIASTRLDPNRDPDIRKNAIVVTNLQPTGISTISVEYFSPIKIQPENPYRFSLCHFKRRARSKRKTDMWVNFVFPP
jgi:hypothetical protein